MTTATAPLPVRLAQRIEEASGLDGAVEGYDSLAQKVRDRPELDEALRGMWLGHAVHPLLTDLPLGMWTSATVLDLVGGETARPAARKLLGLGILTALPTAITGLAEWGSVSMKDKEVRRVGFVHAMSNNVALMLYVSSYRARRKAAKRGDDRAVGVKRALAGGLVASFGGFLGGHLVEVRNVSSSHPAFH